VIGGNSGPQKMSHLLHVKVRKTLGLLFLIAVNINDEGHREQLALFPSKTYRSATDGEHT
jgi:hypothetical protein